MFRIRLHGRGGQGMKSAAQILGGAFFLEGFEVQDAPRYGAERRGAPIFAYVRAAREPIQERGVIARPDLVVVADDTLIPIPAAGVLPGIGEDTVMLVRSTEEGALWRQRLRLAGPLLSFGAGADVPERGEMPFVGAACAGAAARLVGVIRRESLERAVRQEMLGHDEAAVAQNAADALAAFEAMAPDAGRVREGTVVVARDWRPPEWIELPAEDVTLAAPDIHAAATSELAKTGLWRTLRPVIDYARCSRCSWICSTLCPDGAIRVDPDHTPRIDLDYCKGCMVCLAVCPPHAIAAIAERRQS